MRARIESSSRNPAASPRTRNHFRMMTMANIAFLGTGLLGGAFAEACAKRGDTVVAWNRSADKVLALGQFGVKAAATPAEAVKGASRVHFVLKDDAVVEEVIAAARPGLAANAILIDHSTTLPALTAERAKRLHAQGLKYLHCPVFMMPQAARNAQGSMLAAGPKALFEGVKADLARMTGRLEYLGERADLAAVNKLLGNAMIIGMSATMADVLTLAKASGVAGADAIKLLAPVRCQRDDRDAGTGHGERQLHPKIRAGHGAQGCAADARSCRRAADGRVARHRGEDGSADRSRAWRQGRERGGHRRGAVSANCRNGQSRCYQCWSGRKC